MASPIAGFTTRMRQGLAAVPGLRALRRWWRADSVSRDETVLADAAQARADAERADALERCLACLKPDLDASRRAQVRDTLDAILDCGYLELVDRLDADVGIQGRRLLEIGCGQCWHAPLLLARGAAGFVGVDQYKDFRTNKVFDRRFLPLTETPERMRNLPLRLDDFVSSFRGLEVHSADFLNFETERRFDVAYLLSVTEHLEDVRAVFRRIADLLDTNGLIYFAHHNYYCWNGHHMVPRTVAEYDPADPAMRAVADWGHVSRLVGNDQAASEYLNGIRLREIMGIVQELFIVEHCLFEKSTPERGGDRLSAEVRGRLPEFTETELLVEMAYCAARKRSDLKQTANLQGRADRHEVSIRLTWSNPETGHCFLTRVPALGNLSDLVLFEDDRPLGPGDSLHADIRNLGGGRYSIWGNYLYFSTSDNTNPRTNGRRYRLSSAEAAVPQSAIVTSFAPSK